MLLGGWALNSGSSQTGFVSERPCCRAHLVSTLAAIAALFRGLLSEHWIDWGRRLASIHRRVHLST